MISEDSASPFFAFSCGLAGGVAGSSSVAAGTLECWQTQKAGSGFLGLLSCCAYLTHDFEGVVFSGVNLMALIFLPPIFYYITDVGVYQGKGGPEMESEVVYETLVSPTDLTPVLEALEMMQQSLDKTNVSLEQLHVDASLAFLAVVLLIGVILAAQSALCWSRYGGRNGRNGFCNQLGDYGRCARSFCHWHDICLFRCPGSWPSGQLL